VQLRYGVPWYNQPFPPPSLPLLESFAATLSKSHRQLNSHPSPSPENSKIHRCDRHHTLEQTDSPDLPICGDCFPSIHRFFDCSPYRCACKDKLMIESAVSIIDRTKTLPVSAPAHAIAIPGRRTIAYRTLRHSIECFE